MNLHEWAALRQRMRPFPELFRFDDQWLAACLPTDELRNEYLKKVHWRMTLIGTEGAGMFNHQVCVLRVRFSLPYRANVSWFCAADPAHCITSLFTRIYLPILDRFSFTTTTVLFIALIIRSPGRVAHRQLAGATQRRQTMAHLRADRGTTGRIAKYSQP